MDFKLLNRNMRFRHYHEILHFPLYVFRYVCLSYLSILVGHKVLMSYCVRNMKNPACIPEN